LVDAAKAPLQGLSKVFNRRSAVGGRSSGDDTIWALKDVSFEVKQGEVVGIIGRNGAGKSTLLKILSRITEPTEGRVELRGRVGSLLEVGTGFHPELTGHENIYLYGAILGMDRWEITRKFDEIVAFAEIDKFIDTPVKKYSSGMYMRLAFAVAAHLEPEILLVDEVLAVGDAAFQKKCLGKMGDVSKEGRTVLFVSHNMGAVEALCGRGLVLSEGMISFDGNQMRAISTYLAGLERLARESLSLRKDRSGNGRLRVVDISIGIEGQASQGYWRPGEKCTVRFAYEVLADAHLSHVDIGFSLETYYGKKLLYANTIVTKEHIPIKGQSGGIYCTIEEFPLSPGDYHLTYDVYSNTELLDRVESAAVVAVEERDGVEAWTAWGGYGTVCSRYRWGHI
jgi:lipopolysaccharide transport system ATP-binding protein